MSLATQSTVPLRKPWSLPPHGLALFEGDRQAQRLGHYFLPGLIRKGHRILFLDGANCANPHLMARLAGRSGIPFGQFSRQIQIARAFTCFQLTELIARVPQWVIDFPARVLIVTAFPDLYLDQDVRDGEARIAFEHALGDLCRWSRSSRQALTIAVISSGFAAAEARRNFIGRTRAAATEVWKFNHDEHGKLTLSLQPSSREQRTMIKRGKRWDARFQLSET
ncbi:MAG: hypothetical protein ACRD18_14955 [Terriglobia bacterium]